MFRLTPFLLASVLLSGSLALAVDVAEPPDADRVPERLAPALSSQFVQNDPVAGILQEAFQSLHDGDPVNLVRRLLDLLARHRPPVSESDIGGEKEEAATNEVRESALREQRLDRDKDKRATAKKEYD